MASFLTMKICPFPICNPVGHLRNSDRLQLRCNAMCSSEESTSRRQFVIGCGAISLTTFLNSNNFVLAELPALAGEESNALDDKDDGLVGAVKSLFDPNEKTKSGKVLPKAYLKSAREVVKTLRESLKEDSKDMAKFRRTADAAKESIRDYLGGWRGQKTVVNEESYVVLEKVIRSLASFYSKAGLFLGNSIFWFHCALHNGKEVLKLWDVFQHGECMMPDKDSQKTQKFISKVELHCRAKRAMDITTASIRQIRLAATTKYSRESLFREST